MFPKGSNLIKHRAPKQSANIYQRCKNIKNDGRFKASFIFNFESNDKSLNFSHFQLLNSRHPYGKNFGNGSTCDFFCWVQLKFAAKSKLNWFPVDILPQLHHRFKLNVVDVLERKFSIFGSPICWYEISKLVYKQFHRFDILDKLRGHYHIECLSLKC